MDSWFLRWYIPTASLATGMMLIIIQIQAINIVFALCGIVGPLYGIGRTFAEVDPTNLKSAMFVCVRPLCLRKRKEDML